mmetsp:Transcript_8433/g.22802  ORF Transcript_8433/g.22802 Transcript_8433/m.22802 type:complete len:220 (-) Transcript_8433:847-1506(-)
MDGKNCEEEKRQQLQGTCNPVDDVILHPLEDFSSVEDGSHNCRQTRGSEHNVCCGLCSVRCSLDSNSNIGSLQSRSIVDTVAGHSAHVSSLAKNFDDGKFVVWVHLCKAIGIFHQTSIILTQALVPHRLCSGQVFRGQDIHSHAKHSACFDGNGLLISCDHLDIDSILVGLFDSCSGIRTRRIQEGKNSQQLPLVLGVRARDGESTNSTGSKLHDLCID